MTSGNETMNAAPDDGTEAGAILAALLAAGIGCFAMGVVTTLSEAVKSIADMLNLYKPVGPLSGKSLAAILAWLVAWAALSRSARGKQPNAVRWLTLTFILVGIGAVMTFPPFFDLFGDRQTQIIRFSVYPITPG